MLFCFRSFLSPIASSVASSVLGHSYYRVSVVLLALILAMHVVVQLNSAIDLLIAVSIGLLIIAISIALVLAVNVISYSLLSLVFAN